MIDPVSRQVYRIPKEAITHDENKPVYLRLETFLDKGRVGNINGQNLVEDNDDMEERVLDPSWICAVQLGRRNHGGEAHFTWATRAMIDMSDVDEQTLEKMGLDGTVRYSSVGQEFLWLWPMGRAHNMWLHRLNQLKSEDRESIDAVVPSVSYMQASLDVTLSHKDIDGCELVPFEKLTPSQRFVQMHATTPLVSMTGYRPCLASDRHSMNTRNEVNDALSVGIRLGWVGATINGFEVEAAE